MGWHERLGFGPGQVVLIIHADDAGFSEGHNHAIAKCHAHGTVTSASVMIDWPYGEQFLVDQAPSMADIGLHFVMSGLCILDHQIVENDLHRQFNKMAAIRKPRHIDTHGGVVFMSEVSARAYTGFSIQKNIPAMISKSSEVISRYPEIVSVASEYSFPVLDDILMAPANQSLDDKIDWVKNTLQGLRPGVYQWIVHPSDSREGCLDMFVLMSPQLKRLLCRRRFVLTNWVEIWERYSDM